MHEGWIPQNGSCARDVRSPTHRTLALVAAFVSSAAQGNWEETHSPVPALRDMDSLPDFMATHSILILLPLVLLLITQAIFSQLVPLSCSLRLSNACPSSRRTHTVQNPQFVAQGC